MSPIVNRQPALKPQDLYVLLALLSRTEGATTYPDLARFAGISVSESHSSLKRAALSRLVLFENGRPAVQRIPLQEFLLHGAPYAFPAVRGPLMRGVPTAYAVAPLNKLIAPSGEPVPVWPHAKGTVRGMSLLPLYPSAPDAALRNERLYESLALFDALRIGNAREREAAQRLLKKLLS